MTLENIEKKAVGLMAEHGLESWTFDFDKGQTRLGCCHHNLRRITMSRQFALRNPWTQLKETMLHEIAHALLPVGEGHGRRWRLQYINIGGNPNRNYAEVKTAPKPFTGTCPNCKTKCQSRRRTNTACYNCCKKYNSGRYTREYAFVWKENRK